MKYSTIRSVLITIFSYLIANKNFSAVLKQLERKPTLISIYLGRLRLAAAFAWIKKGQVPRAVRIVDGISLAHSSQKVLEPLESIYNLTGQYKEAEKINKLIKQKFSHNREVAHESYRIFSEMFYHFGHASLLEIYVKAQILGMIPAGNNVIVGNPSRFANPALINYWGKYFQLVDNADQLKCASLLNNLHAENFTAIRCSDGKDLGLYEFGMHVQLEWEKKSRPQLLTLNNDHIEIGYCFLRSKGVPNDAWFCTLHVRCTDDHLRNVRNADVKSYGLALDEIANRGGWVVRLGDQSMPPIDTKLHQNVIDYALSPIKKPALDIFFLAEGRFLIGTGSGPGALPISFGKSVLYTNWGPLLSRHWGQNDLLLPKQYFHVKERRFLKLQERMSSAYGHVESATMLRENGIEIIDNSPEEILHAVIEKLEGSPKLGESPFNYEHTVFRDLSLKCGVYPSKLTEHFVKQYKEFFEGNLK